MLLSDISSIASDEKSNVFKHRKGDKFCRNVTVIFVSNLDFGTIFVQTKICVECTDEGAARGTDFKASREQINKKHILKV